jgi:AcrR family transcriptional regulator
MGRALFENADFLSAARAIAAARGPAAVTVDSVTAQLKAPKGSFYYRFASRDLLLGELWLTTVLAYQQDFVAAIEAGDGLAAALHTPAWVRRHLDDARLLLLYSRHDFVQGDWPAPLKRGVRDQAERFEGCLKSFARRTFGRAGAPELRRSTFVLAEVPIAAVRQHLERREPPPPLVDDLIAATYRAICGPRTSLPGSAPVASPSR